jgi:hypothetical protein
MAQAVLDALEEAGYEVVVVLDEPGKGVSRGVGIDFGRRAVGLGVPNETYPAPVANAVTILGDALESYEEQANLFAAVLSQQSGARKVDQ